MMTTVKYSRGITLIELLVVLSIIGILFAALGFSYESWNGRYDMEDQIKQIYTDLANARSTAMAQDRAYFVIFPDATSYTLYQDTSPGPDGDGQLDVSNDTKLTGYPKYVERSQTLQAYSVVPEASPPITATSITNLTITFEKNGVIENPSLLPAGTDQGVAIRLTSTGSTGAGPDYDCINMTATMISMGKWGDCDNSSSTPDECCVK